MLNFGKGFQEHLDRSPNYWQDFGRRCAGSLRQFGTVLTSTQLENTIRNTLSRMHTETGKEMEASRAEAFAKGMREGYTQQGEAK